MDIKDERNVIDRLRNKPIPSPVDNAWLVELVGSTPSSSATEERTKKTGSIVEYQRLYITDSLTFTLVNFLVEKIASRFIFVGDPEAVKRLQKWSDTIKLKIRFEDMLRDVVIAGGTWTETMFSSIALEKIKIINPATMDYLRDKTSDNVILDDEGEPLCIVQDVNGIKRYWYKDRIEKQGGEIIYTAVKGEDIRKRIKYIKLISYGDSELGISFIQPVYRSAIIRANLEDMIGESAFRGGGIVAYVTGEPPADIKANLKKDLLNITSRNIFLLQDKIKLDTVPVPELTQREALVYLLADFQASGMGAPLDIVLSGGRTYKQDLANKMGDLEQRIMSYQDRLTVQVEEYFINPMLKMWGMEDKAHIQFLVSSSVTQLNRARLISTLAKREIFTYDPEVEKQIRKELMLPVGSLDKRIAEWKKNGGKPLREPSIDDNPFAKKEEDEEQKSQKDNDDDEDSKKKEEEDEE